MLDDNFRIITLSQDSLFLSRLQDEIKKKFPTLPFEMGFFDSGKTALPSLKAFQPHLIIAPIQFIGMEPAEFEETCLRSSNLTSVIFLGKIKEKTDAANFAWPLVEWGSFLNLLQSYIPEELKSRLGIQTKDTELYDILTAYGKKFPSPKVDPNVTVESLIPVLSGLVEASSDTSFAPLTNVNISAESSLPQFQVPARWIVFEIGFSLGLMALTIASFYYFEGKVMFYILVVMTTFAILTLVLSRYFNPLIKRV